MRGRGIGRNRIASFDVESEALMSAEDASTVQPISPFRAEDPINHVSKALGHGANLLFRHKQWILFRVVSGVSKPGSRVNDVEKGSDVVRSICDTAVKDSVIENNARADSSRRIYS